MTAIGRCDDVLTKVVGMPEAEVAKLSEEQARAAWGAYTTGVNR